MSLAFSPAAETRRLLDAIAAQNPTLNLFAEVFAEEALSAAAESERRLQAGMPLSELDGVCFGVKDNIAVKGHTQGCASRSLQSYVSPVDACCVERMRAAGMIPLGRLNMDEFGMGSYTTHSVYGAAHNPHDPERSCGGSSGGSAAAVAAGLVPIALGSDTGGSIRQPASHCGVIGVKPAWGAVSRRGLAAFASSLDCVGFFCRDVQIAPKVFELISGADDGDMTADGELCGDDGLPVEASALRIGVLCDEQLAGISPAVRTVWNETCAALRGIGCVVAPFALPDLDAVLAAYYLISACEAGSNLSRYDGIRYGCRPEADTPDALLTAARTSGFGIEVRRRMMMGGYSLSEGAMDAHYLRAVGVRETLTKKLAQLTAQFDILLTPAAPDAAPLLKDCDRLDPAAVYRGDVFTVPFSLAGLPSVCIPCAQGNSLPVGLCLTAAKPQTARLIRIAAALSDALRNAKGGVRA